MSFLMSKISYTLNIDHTLYHITYTIFVSVAPNFFLVAGTRPDIFILPCDLQGEEEGDCCPPDSILIDNANFEHGGGAHAP